MSDSDELSNGDPVEVTNVDGETTEGKVIAVHDQTVSEASATWMDADDATLHDFWRGHDVGPDERVVAVNLGSGTYDYPESKVTKLDDAVLTTVENRGNREIFVTVGTTSIALGPGDSREVIVRGSD